MSLDDLATLYSQSRGEDEIQDKILFAYSQRNEPAAVDKLIAVASSDPNREMRKKAIFWLGQKKNDRRAIEFLTKLVSRGEIPHVRLSTKCLLFRPADLDAWLVKRSRVQAGGAL